MAKLAAQHAIGQRNFDGKVSMLDLFFPPRLVLMLF